MGVLLMEENIKSRKNKKRKNETEANPMLDPKFRNKTAVAVSYHSDEPAPRIIASGKGYLADKIIKKAGENKIPLHKDDQLAGTLSRLQVGDFIPPELYEVVAEILLFVDDMDRIKKKVLPGIKTQN
jgi:flagellar biosynthesis protein